MTERKKCQGISKTGNNCKNYATKEADFCRFHLPITINNIEGTYFNEECPICLTDEGDMHLSPCMHRLHLTCAEGMGTLNCPLCKEIITNFPNKIKKKINANTKKYERDKIQEEHEELRQQMGGLNINQHEMDRIHSTFIEIISAFQYLQDNLIPSQYIPVETDIILPIDSPILSQGSVFTAIITNALERVMFDIENYDEYFETAFTSLPLVDARESFGSAASGREAMRQLDTSPRHVGVLTTQNVRSAQCEEDYLLDNCPFDFENFDEIRRSINIHNK
jgi:hypothetical protein